MSFNQQNQINLHNIVKMPDSEDQIVTLCAMGIRSAKALGILAGMGYTNLSNYRGSFNDWHENTEKLH